MSTQLNAIIIYGRPDEMRVIELHPGELNIVTGLSKTGKSSLLSIIDFCLGATECRIADGEVRSHASWYGLRVTNGESEVFIARKDPGPGRYYSSDIMVRVGRKVPIPSFAQLQPNTNLNGLISEASKLIGIGDNSTDILSNAPSGFAATIRHALLLSLQGQNEVASAELLFHRQSDPQMISTIQDVLPYFLGATNAEELRQQRHLKQMQRAAKALARALSDSEALSTSSQEMLSTLVTEARSVGFLTPAPIAQSDSCFALFVMDF